MSDSVTIRWRHADHPNDERYDKITIECLPRWKESELSGDEWRFSYVVIAWRKGEQICRRSFSRLSDAMAYLPTFPRFSEGDQNFDSEAFERTFSLCDQPSCSQKATAFFERIKPYTRSGEELVKSEYYREYRQFCDKHSFRGDCDLDDADHNYRPISREEIHP